MITFPSYPCSLQITYVFDISFSSDLDLYSYRRDTTDAPSSKAGFYTPHIPQPTIVLKLISNKVAYETHSVKWDISHRDNNAYLNSALKNNRQISYTKSSLLVSSIFLAIFPSSSFRDLPPITILDKHFPEQNSNRARIPVTI